MRKNLVLNLLMVSSTMFLVVACNNGQGGSQHSNLGEQTNNVAISAVVNTNKVSEISFSLANESVNYAPVQVKQTLKNVYDLNFNLPSSKTVQRYHLIAYDNHHRIINQKDITVPITAQGQYYLVLQDSSFIPSKLELAVSKELNSTAGDAVSIITPMVRLGLSEIPIVGPLLSAAADVGLGFLTSFLNNDAVTHQQELDYYKKLQTDYATFKQTLDTTSQLVTTLQSSTNSLATTLNLFTLQNMTYTLLADAITIEGSSATGSTDCSNGGALNAIFSRYNYVQAMFFAYGASTQVQMKTVLQSQPDLRHALEKNGLSSTDMQTLNRCIQGVIPQVTYLDPNINTHPVDSLATLSADISNYIALNYKTSFAPMEQILSYTSMLYSAEILNTSLALDQANALVNLAQYISDNFSSSDSEYSSSSPTSQITVTQAQQVDAISQYYSPMKFGLNSAVLAQLNAIKLPAGNYTNDCVISRWDGSSQISSSCHLNSNEPNLYSPVVTQNYSTKFNDGSFLYYADGILFANDTQQTTDYDYSSQPPGDYSNTCKNIVWDSGSGTLSADCGDGGWPDYKFISTTLNYVTACVIGTKVGNSFGSLVCNPWNGTITGDVGYLDKTVANSKSISQHELYYQKDSAANKPQLPDGAAAADFSFLASTNGNDTIDDNGILLNDQNKNAIGIIRDNTTGAVFELVKIVSNGKNLMYLRCPGGVNAKTNSECYAGPEGGLGNEVITNGYQYYLYTSSSNNNLATGLRLVRNLKAVTINYTTLITPDSSAESNMQVMLNNVSKLTQGAGLMTLNMNGPRFILVDQLDNNLVIYHCTLDNCHVGYPIWASNTEANSAINVATLLGVDGSTGIVLSANGITALNGALLASFDSSSGQIGAKALLACGNNSATSTTLIGNLSQCNQ